MSKVCINALMEEFDDITQRDAALIVRRLGEEKNKAFAEGAMNPKEYYDMAAREIIAIENNHTMKAKIQIAENIRKRKDVVAIVSQFNDKARGLEAVLTGTNDPEFGTGISIDARQKGNANRLRIGLLRDVQKSGLRNVLLSGDIDAQIRVELSELNKKKGNPGVTENNVALDAAKIYKRHLDRVRGLLNGSGAFIRKLDGYAGRVSHSPEKILAAGFDKWFQEILPMLDEKKTFTDGVASADVMEMLRSVYNDITTGRKESISDQISSDQVIKMIGSPANMAKRVEQSRVLHFKNAEFEHAYLQKYGQYNNMLDDMTALTERAARDAAAMQVLGTNPRATYEILRRGFKLTDKKYDWLDNRAAEIFGDTRSSGIVWYAKASGNIRSVVSMAKLGSAIFSSFPDIAAKAVNIRAATGQNYFSALSESFTSFLDSAKSKEARLDTAFLTGVASDSFLNAAFDRINATDIQVGKMSRAIQTFHRINGLGWWTDVNRAAHARVLSAGLGMRSHLRLSSLDRTIVNHFRRFGFDEVTWDLIRSAAKRGEDGRLYIGVADIAELSDEKISEFMELEEIKPTQRNIEVYRNEMATRLATYYAQNVSDAMLEPGAKERSIWLRGTSADTPEGQVFRFIAQFKSYPTSLITRTLDQLVVGRGGHSWARAFREGRADVAGIASFMAASTGLGYLSLMAKDVIRGKGPRDPFDVNTVAEAMVHGGAMGIYGDFLLGEFDSRYGRSALSALAGPVIGQVDDVFDIFNRLKSGEIDKITTSAFRFLINNTPGSNLFYVRGALDYLFLYDLQEKLNPGFLSRMEDRMGNRGQSFLIDPR